MRTALDRDRGVSLSLMTRRLTRELMDLCLSIIIILYRHAHGHIFFVTNISHTGSVHFPDIQFPDSLIAPRLWMIRTRILCVISEDMHYSVIRVKKKCKKLKICKKICKNIRKFLIENQIPYSNKCMHLYVAHLYAIAMVI